MKAFFENLRYRFSAMMQNRYGTDEFSRFLSVLALVPLVVYLFYRNPVLYFIALVLLGYSWFRSFSKNLYKRGQERQKYLAIKEKITKKFRFWRNRIRDRKTHRYVTCPGCKTVARIKKPVKGSLIVVTCPKCGSRYEVKF